MMRQGWLIGLCSVLVFSGCAKEKEKATGWSSFPVAIYSDPAMTATDASRSDFLAAMAFWESHAGRHLFDYRGDWSGGQPFTGTADKPSSILANVVLFQSPWPFAPNTAGMTTLISTESGFQGAIIMINPSVPVCTGDCFGDRQRTSQQKLLAHELGHFIGLSHDEGDPTNIMYPSLSPGGNLDSSYVNRAALGQITR